MRTLILILALVVPLGACGSTQSPTSSIGKDIELSQMTNAQAAQIVNEFRDKYGYRTTLQDPAPPPTSISEVLAIVKTNRIDQYDAARNFAIGMSGAEALTLRAYIELSLSSAMLTVASILDEIKARRSAELHQLQMPRATSTALPDAAQRINKLTIEVNDMSKAITALRQLVQEPLTAGKDLADEAIRQNPTNSAGYLGLANYYRMKREWVEYDRALRTSTKNDTVPSSLKTYIVAMEAVERYTDVERCRKMLREVLAQDPQFVQAQASLVLVQSDIEAKYAELQKLRELNPRHPVITTAGKMIEDEYKVTVELRQALSN